MKTEQPIIIAISGGSGSGKTFFAEALYKKLGPENAHLIYQDNYYIDQSANFDKDGGSVNFDHPDALDFKLLEKHLIDLKNNKEVQIPLYDFKTHKRLKETQTLVPKKVIILDGILILTQKYLRKTYTESIYIETPEDIRFKRRLERDVATRGRTPEGVFNQFHNQVKPMHDLFVEPSKAYATHVSSGTDMESFYALLNRVLTMLSKNEELNYLTANSNSFIETQKFL